MADRAAAVLGVGAADARATPAERWDQLALLDLGPASVAEGGEPKAARGRPPGSQNRNNRELRDFLLANYRHPVVGLLAIGTANPAQLLAELTAQRDAFKAMPGGREIPLLPKGASMLDVLELQRRCLAEAAPYVASKMPVDVNVNAPALTVVLGAGVAAEVGAGGGNLVLTVDGQKTQANQGDDDAS